MLRTKMASWLYQKNIGENIMDKKSNYSDSGMKPDKTCHKSGQDMGTEAKKASLPGQQYVPKKTHNESDFVGEKR